MLFFECLKKKAQKLEKIKKICYNRNESKIILLCYLLLQMSINRARTRKLLFQELYARKFNKFDAELFY